MSNALNKPRIAVVFVILFVDLIGFGMIIPIMPYLSAKYGGSAAQVGWLMTIFSLMQFAFSPLWGRLSDRVGRRPVLLWSLFASGWSYILFAYADSYETLFAARCLAGISTANISTAMAYVADLTPEETRSKNLGLVGAAIGLGFVFGPFLGGLLADLGGSFNNEAPFGLGFPALVAGGICLINFLVAFFILNESLPPKASIAPKDPKSILPGTSSNGATNGGRLQVLKRYFMQPIVGRLMTVLLLAGLAMAHMESTLGLFVKDQFEWDVRKASYAFAFVGVMMVFTQGVLIRKLIPMWGERTVLALGLWLGGMGLFSISYASHPWFVNSSSLVLALSMSAIALGVGMINPAVNGSISVLLPREEQGLGLGISQSLAALGRILGPLGGGYLYEAGGPKAPFVFGGLLMMVGLFLVLRMFKRLPVAGKRELRGVR